MTRTFPANRIGKRLALTAVLFLFALAQPALAAASEGNQGSRILQDVNSGQRSCSDLTTDDFDQVGEYVMGRMVGSARGHESMDALMRSMMGAGTEKRMHVFLGRRFTGCGGGRIPTAFGGMMSVMGMMGGGGTGYGGGSMMNPANGGSGGRYYPGSMMGGTRNSDDHDMSAGAWIAMLAVIVLAAALVVWAIRSQQRGRSHDGQSGLQILQQRYASGEIDREEYEQRRRLIEGGT